MGKTRTQLSLIVAATKPVFAYVSKNLTDEHFSCPEPSLEGVELEGFDLDWCNY